MCVLCLCIVLLPFIWLCNALCTVSNVEHMETRFSFLLSYSVFCLQSTWVDRDVESSWGGGGGLELTALFS